ncbi:MAG: HAD-IB family hydrolase [Saprospiraceae bacterium]|nr:HAD-IB family hydrolase [Saprospiraceae bacterium]MCB9322261.1 HAD-IB family hydrolase [Lewinellaceae bacterium]
MEKRLVIFDFDGTLTRKDSMLEFTRYFHGVFRFYIGMLYLSPILLLYKVGFIPNWKAKEFYLTHFFGGLPLLDFQQACERFSLEKIPDILRPLGFHRLKEHQDYGDELVIVSAAIEYWLNPWCHQNKLSCIGTRLALQNGFISGKIEGKNCHGPEKVKRLTEVYDLKKFSEIIVYGDSDGDLEMIKIATKYLYKPFLD